MARLQVAGGRDSLHICRVARIVEGALKASVFCEGQETSSTANKKNVSLMILLLKGKLINICVIRLLTQELNYT